MKNNTLELVISLVLVGLALVIVNPMHEGMSDMALSVLLAGVFVLFCIFAAFVMREGAADERESVHRAVAGRVAFLVGAGALVCGIIVQATNHALDPWLVGALVAMIVGKIVARVYSYHRL